VTSSVSRSRLPSRTSTPRCVPLVPGLNTINLNRMLEERHILLCLLEMDLKVQEAMLVEEQARGLHPFNGRDLSVELVRTWTG
jgi:hypothetical protein